MSYLFQTKGKEAILIFEEENRLWFQIRRPEGCSRPLVLTEDYLYGLEAVYRKGTLYYAYINAEQLLTLRAAGQSPALFQTASVIRDPTKKTHYLLSGENGPLLIFAEQPFAEHPSSDSQLSILQFSPDPESRSIPLDFRETPSFCPYRIGNELFLHLIANGEHLLYHITDKLLFEKVTTCSQTLFTECSPGKAPDQEDHTAQKETVPETENRLLKEQLHSACIQYDELMDTALKYRAEAEKWYQKWLHR